MRGRSAGERRTRGRKEAYSHEWMKVGTSFCLHFILFSSRDESTTISTPPIRRHVGPREGQGRSKLGEKGFSNYSIFII
jgi:hypothetical protein